MFELPTATTDRHDPPDQVTESEWHDALASEPRRLALGVLVEETGPVALADLSRAVAEAEGDADSADADAVRRHRIKFHHVHLPKLDDLGVVEYDRDERLVTN